MQNKIRIKDIAERAGVSTGTVDRILHNRGKVSKKAREAVEKVLSEVDYKPNIHISGMSLKRKYRIIITMPHIFRGEYWESIQNGILRALEEYQNIRVDYQIITYNQYDIFSCRSTFDQIIKMEADAMIIGPTFPAETVKLTNELDKRSIPYIFVDSAIKQSFPLAFFSSDHYTCGYLMSKLITSIIPKSSDIGILQAVRIGNESANTTVLRKKGFMDYLSEKNLNNKILSIPFSLLEPEKNNFFLSQFFKENKNVGGIVVLNSRGNIIANYMYDNHIDNIKLVCVDLTQPNIEALKKDKIYFLIGQEPEQQGFLAMKTLIEYLVFRNPVQVENYVPLDILTKETINYYREFNEAIFG
jgi:LacI family transcriptional regulator